MYDDEPSVWDDILRLAVKDLAEVQHSGIQLYGGDKLYPICLGNKGDWSYLEPGAMIMHNFVWGMYIIFPVKMMFFFFGSFWRSRFLQPIWSAPTVMPPKVKEAVPKRSQLESATCVWPALLAMIGKICFFQASGNIVCFSFRDFLLMWSSVLIWGTLVPQECFYTVYGWSTTKRNFTTLGAWNFVYRTATFGWVPQCSSPFPPPWHLAHDTLGSRQGVYIVFHGHSPTSHSRFEHRWPLQTNHRWLQRILQRPSFGKVSDKIGQTDF